MGHWRIIPTRETQVLAENPVQAPVWPSLISSHVGDRRRIQNLSSYLVENKQLLRTDNKSASNTVRCDYKFNPPLQIKSKSQYDVLVSRNVDLLPQLHGRRP